MDSGLAATRRPGMTAGLACAKSDQSVEKHAAFLELADRDELVGLVRLIDRARADDDGRNAGLREQPAFGAIGDLAVAVASRKLLRQQRHLGVFRRVEPGELGAVLEFEAGLGRDR